MIDFNVPPFTGKEIDYIRQAVENHKICGDGMFTKKCSRWMEETFSAKHVLLSPHPAPMRWKWQRYCVIFVRGMK